MRSSAILMQRVLTSGEPVMDAPCVRSHRVSITAIARCDKRLGMLRRWLHCVGVGPLDIWNRMQRLGSSVRVKVGAVVWICLIWRIAFVKLGCTDRCACPTVLSPKIVPSRVTHPVPPSRRLGDPFADRMAGMVQCGENRSEIRNPPREIFPIWGFLAWPQVT